MYELKWYSQGFMIGLASLHRIDFANVNSSYMSDWYTFWHLKNENPPKFWAEIEQFTII